MKILACFLGCLFLVACSNDKTGVKVTPDTQAVVDSTVGDAAVVETVDGVVPSADTPVVIPTADTEPVVGVDTIPAVDTPVVLEVLGVETAPVAD